MKKKIVQRKNSKRSKAPTFLPLIIFALILIGSAIWYLRPRPATPIGINLVGSATGTVSLTLSPSTLNLAPNTESTLVLSIDAGTSHVTAAQVELTYDESKIGIPSITQGDFLTGSIGPSEVANGKISFTYVAPTTTEVIKGITGSGTLATIKIKPPVVGSSAIVFTEKTLILAGPEVNALSSAIDSTITVTSSEIIASADPSVSPSAPASIAPSAPATPEKPDKPTGLRSNCFDNGNKITLRWDSVSGISSYKIRMDQTSGSDDKSVDNITKTDYEFNIIPDQKYSWWVHSSKNGVDSVEAKISEVVCAKTIVAATPTPAPTITPKPTVRPTTKPTTTPISSPVIASPAAKTSTTTAKPIAITALPYTCPELCGDFVCNVGCGESFQNCKADCTINDFSTGDTTTEPPVTPKTFWEKIIDWISSVFVPKQK
jgi:hypothetical protein